MMVFVFTKNRAFRRHSLGPVLSEQRTIRRAHSFHYETISPRLRHENAHLCFKTRHFGAENT